MKYLFAIVEDRHERFLGYLNIANAFHSLFTLFLFFEQLHLSGDISAVQLLRDIFAKALDGFSCDDLAAYSNLKRNFKLMPWDSSSQSYDQLTATGLCFAAMCD